MDAQRNMIPCRTGSRHEPVLHFPTESVDSHTIACQMTMQQAGSLAFPEIVGHLLDPVNKALRPKVNIS